MFKSNKRIVLPGNSVCCKLLHRCVARLLFNIESLDFFIRHIIIKSTVKLKDIGS